MILDTMDSLMNSVQDGEKFDPSIADRVVQDNDAAYRRWLETETKDWRHTP